MRAGRAVCDCHSPRTRFPWASSVSLFPPCRGGAVAGECWWVLWLRVFGSEEMDFSLIWENVWGFSTHPMASRPLPSLCNSPVHVSGSSEAKEWVRSRKLTPEGTEHTLASGRSCRRPSAPPSANLWFLPSPGSRPPSFSSQKIPPPLFPLCLQPDQPHLQTLSGAPHFSSPARHTWAKPSRVPWTVAVVSSLTLQPHSSHPPPPPLTWQQEVLGKH